MFIANCVCESARALARGFAILVSLELTRQLTAKHTNNKRMLTGLEPDDREARTPAREPTASLLNCLAAAAKWTES